MKIIQITPSLNPGDAVGNDILAINDYLKKEGYQTDIYSENIHHKIPKGTALSIKKLPKFSNDDVILYHGSIGSDLNYKLPKMGGKLAMIYHNITPPNFFALYSQLYVDATQIGLDGMEYLADKISYCIADSEFNKKCLQELGCNCKIDVCPILIPFEDYEKEPDVSVIRKYSNDGYTNLLFVGRIAPNKKQEDVIAAFYYYHKYYNEKSRLFLVGNWRGLESYYQRLCLYVEKLDLKGSVIFPGQISFSEILAYYKIADAFVCMSEHEGFCVPLVEAMFFKVPIIAYDAAAISETLGDAGILLSEKEPSIVARAIDRIIRDNGLRKYLNRKSDERLCYFSTENVKKIFKNCIDGLENE